MKSASQKDIILDRDGVINIDSDEYIKSPAEWIPIAGSIEAIAKLYQQGYRIFIATNQSGIARGLYNTTTLTAIHQKMLALITQAGGQIHGIAICPHGPDEHCDCRKPKAGLFFQLAQTYAIDLSQTIAIGDAWRDIIAARTAGCKLILVKTGKGLLTIKQQTSELDNLIIVADLAAAVDWILKEE